MELQNPPILEMEEEYNASSKMASLANNSQTISGNAGQNTSIQNQDLQDSVVITEEDDY